MDKYIAALTDVHILEVVAATVAIFMLSSLWYSVLFQKAVMKLDKSCNSDTPCRPAISTMVKGFVAMFFTCYLIGIIDSHTGGNAFAIYASVIAIWLFTMLDMIHAVIWSNMPFKLFLIYTFNTLTNFLLASTVFWVI